MPFWTEVWAIVLALAIWDAVKEIWLAIWRGASGRMSREDFHERLRQNTIALTGKESL